MHPKKQRAAFAQTNYVETVTIVPDIKHLETVAAKTRDGVELSTSDLGRIYKIAGHYVSRHSINDKSATKIEEVYTEGLRHLKGGRTWMGIAMWSACIGRALETKRESRYEE